MTPMKARQAGLAVPATHRIKNSDDKNIHRNVVSKQLPQPKKMEARCSRKEK